MGFETFFKNSFKVCSNCCASRQKVEIKWSTLGYNYSEIPWDETILKPLATGFVPFGITIADAAFPEHEQHVAGLNGRITKITKNSWVKHVSFSYNERYNFLIRMTWVAYSFFATIALGIALMKGMLLCNL